jgi:hypothetical protein
MCLMLRAPQSTNTRKWKAVTHTQETIELCKESDLLTGQRHRPERVRYSAWTSKSEFERGVRMVGEGDQLRHRADCPFAIYSTFVR